MARKGDSTNVWAVIEVMEPSRCLQGKRFSITGHLGLPRDQVVKIIEACGGRFEEQPRYGVNFLVTNRDWNSGTTAEPKCSLKLRKAMENGIKVLSEDELVDMIVSGDAAAKAREEGK